MKEEKMIIAEIAPDAGYDGEGIALAVIRDGRALRIGYLPQEYAKLMVDRGRLPARAYEEIGFFRDDNPVGDTFPGSAVGSPEIVNPWKALAEQMEKGDDSVHAGLCSDKAFRYWVKA